MGCRNAAGQEFGEGVVGVFVHAEALAPAGTQHVEQPVGFLLLLQLLDHLEDLRQAVALGSHAVEHFRQGHGAHRRRQAALG